MRFKAAIFLALLTGCGSGDVKELSEVQSVQVTGETATIDALIRMFDEKRYVTQAAGVVEKASEAMRDDAAYSAVRQIRFQFSAVTVDELGNEGEAPTFNVAFPMGSLRAANFGNLYGAQPMNLASQVEAATPEGLHLIAATCGDPEKLEEAMKFCAKAIGGR
jgi:hypothetical protein